MRITRTTIAAGLLALEAGLATLGVVVHYGLSSEYGDVTASALEGWRDGFTSGTGVLALAVVTLAGLLVGSVAPRLGLRLTAAAVPVLMVLAMLAATPAALQHKLRVQYDATPRCVSGEGMGPGPGSRAARASQQALDSVEHVGYFGGGGASGVEGCSRSFVLTEDVDVLQHYRGALRDAGWRIVHDDAHHLRARRGTMVLDVTPCRDGGAVWAGRTDAHGRARCGDPQ